MHTHTHTHMHTHMHTHTHAYAYTHAHTHAHTYTRICIHTHMHMHMHTTHTCTCTHTHIQGDYYEGMSALSGLLSVTTVIDRLNPFQLREERYSCFTGLRNFPDCSTVDAINCLVSVWESECVCVCECHGWNLSVCVSVMGGVLNSRRSSGKKKEKHTHTKKRKFLPCGESNPGHGGESAGS